MTLSGIALFQCLKTLKLILKFQNVHFFSDYRKINLRVDQMKVSQPTPCNNDSFRYLQHMRVADWHLSFKKVARICELKKKKLWSHTLGCTHLREIRMLQKIDGQNFDRWKFFPKRNWSPWRLHVQRTLHFICHVEVCHCETFKQTV